LQENFVTKLPYLGSCADSDVWKVDDETTVIWKQLFIAIAQWEFCLLTCRLMIAHVLGY